MLLDNITEENGNEVARAILPDYLDEWQEHCVAMLESNKILSMQNRRLTSREVADAHFRCLLFLKYT